MSKPEFAHTPTTLGELHHLPKPVLLIAGASLLLLFFLYTLYPAFPTAAGKSLGGWTWLACNSYHGFLHGRLVLIIFPWLIYFAYLRSKDLTISPSYWGLISLMIGFSLFYSGARATQPRFALFGAPFVVIGLAHYLFGRKIAKTTLFPAFFLWFAIPIPGFTPWFFNFLEPRIFSATVNISPFIGLDLTSSGPTIIIGETKVEFGIGSFLGHRSFWFLILSASIYANYTQRSLWKKLLLFLSIIPLFAFASSCRLIGIFALVYHDYDKLARPNSTTTGSGFSSSFPSPSSPSASSATSSKNLCAPPRPLCLRVKKNLLEESREHPNNGIGSDSPFARDPPIQSSQKKGHP